jgi:flagellar motor protein MotB
MGRKEWQQMDSNSDLAAIGISAHRGRGWRIFSGFLLVGTATFAAAYYLPLFRAHASLSREYRTLAKQANTQHQQLTDTVETLKKLTTDCDKLKDAVGKQQTTSNKLAVQADSLERSLQAPLKKYLGSGKLQLERRQENLKVTLASPAMLSATGANLTDAGKKALCVLGDALKTADVRIQIQGLGPAPPANSAHNWSIAAARAGTAAQLLTESCGIESKKVQVRVEDLATSNDAIALVLEITPVS